MMVPPMKLSHLLTPALTLALVACVDTTGLTGDIHKEPHPKSNANGAVIVVEFADLQCPACRAAHELIVKPLLEKKGSVIRYEFHHFPLRSIHRFALDAAEAAECAGDQKKFWEYVDLVYTEQDALGKNALIDWSQKLKLDEDLFYRCTRSHIKRDAILAEYETGQKAGVTGTPTFFVNGQRVESTVEAITAAIDASLKGTQQRL